MSRSTAPTIERPDARSALDAERDLDAQRVAPAPDRREGERTIALRLLSHPSPAGEQQFALPLLATAGDLREVVQYLKRKPHGVSVVEALDDFRRRVFEPRKVAAYEFWGIVVREGDRLHLSPLGWEFARKLAPEAEAYRAILDNTAPYRAALEWIHRQDADVVTHACVAAFWQERYCAALGPNEKTVEGNVVCFFHLCQAAELGVVTIGKRGQPARLRLDRAELSAYLATRATHASNETTHADAGTLHSEPERKLFRPPVNAAPVVADARTATTGEGEPRTSRAEPLRVFISSGRDAKVVAQVQTALEFAGIESRIVARGEPDSLPVADEAFETMRRCEAALIVVTPDDCAPSETGETIVNKNLLVEIGAAFVLYDRRVALLWDERLPLPCNLRGLQHFEFADNALTWDVGVRLLKAIKDFQEHARRDVPKQS
ncbi:MAG TPA: TIR domain-containing protein [Pyrinomonadaceae bacterium]|jgi:predicted nucleotide-binding protein|nr:TIR domain-containing protein [Pyrinomonadaceae bacterium]